MHTEWIHRREQHKNLKLHSTLRHTLEIFMTLHHVLSSTVAAAALSPKLDFTAATAASQLAPRLNILLLWILL